MSKSEPKEDTGVKLSEEETNKVEDSGQKRHGVAPTTGNIASEGTAEADNNDGLEVNGKTNAEEFSDDEKSDLEKKLTKGNVVARVITWSGKYLKVKFFKDNKPFAIYKGKNGSVKEAEKARDEAIKSDTEVQS